MSWSMLPMAPRPAPSGESPIFGKVAIVGLGLIGGSLALAARQRWPSSLVIGVDRNEVLEQAMLRQAIDVAASDLMVIAEADLVVLAAPVRQNLGLLSQLEEHIPGPAVVTDVGSTKQQMVDAARALPPRLTFVGGHPLGGAAHGGIEFARADLFSGRPWLFTPEPEVGSDALARLYEFVSALGARPQSLSPREHDRLLAFLSHLPQLTASALMAVVGDGAQELGLALAGRGLIDTTRLASSPSDIWADVCATNPAAIGEALDQLIGVLQALRSGLDASGETLTPIFEAARRWRGCIVDRPATGGETR